MGASSRLQTLLRPTPLRVNPLLACLRTGNSPRSPTKKGFPMRNPLRHHSLGTTLKTPPRLNTQHRRPPNLGRTKRTGSRVYKKTHHQVNVRRSNIQRNKKAKRAVCWLCGNKTKCSHVDVSVISGDLCGDCWTDALQVDSILANPSLEMRPAFPHEVSPNRFRFPD